MPSRLKGCAHRIRGIYQITVTLVDRLSQALGRLTVKGRGGNKTRNLAVEVMGLAEGAAASALVLDNRRNLEPVPVAFTDGVLTLEKADDLATAAL